MTDCYQRVIYWRLIGGKFDSHKGVKRLRNTCRIIYYHPNLDINNTAAVTRKAVIGNRRVINNKLPAAVTRKAAISKELSSSKTLMLIDVNSGSMKKQ